MPTLGKHEEATGRAPHRIVCKIICCNSSYRTNIRSEHPATTSKDDYRRDSAVDFAAWSLAVPVLLHANLVMLSDCVDCLLTVPEFVRNSCSAAKLHRGDEW